MNTFVNRYSTTGALAEIRNAKAVVDEDDDGSDYMWGSSAGFGSLANGVPSFSIPELPDVSFSVSWVTGVPIIFSSPPRS